ncbi:hypothetical protein [Aquipuribacter sp. SD81]|uniref:hypothetical protein n=1 Tax=Aquipuribacter sp. SD81 TaxID=3127703 RepID=UPI003016FBA0
MSGTTGDDTAEAVGRCPSCGARVVASQEWCTLCHQPLRATGGERDDPDAAGGDLYADPDPAWPAAGDPAVDPGAGTGDATGRRTTDPLGQPVEDLAPVRAPGPGPVDPAGTDAAAARAAEVAEPRAEAMLAELSVTSASERPGSRGPLAGLPRSARLAVGCGAALLLLLVLLAIAGLVGLVL